MQATTPPKHRQTGPIEQPSPGPSRRGAWRSRRPAGALLLAGALALCPGCAPAARIELASLEFGTIDPPAARFIVVEADGCWWWQDTDGRVHVVLEKRQSLPVAGTEFSFRLAVELEDLPAGRAREYQVAKDELEAVASIGFAESRFSSVSGILALYREPGDRLRGSLRLTVARESTQLMGGWGPKTRYLMLGTFLAKQDEGRGREANQSSQVSQPAARDTGNQ